MPSIRPIHLKTPWEKGAVGSFCPTPDLNLPATGSGKEVGFGILAAWFISKSQVSALLRVYI